MSLNSRKICFPDFLNSQSRLPSIDGWRALSITAVLLAHTKGMPGFPREVDQILVRWLPNGHFGVEVFFAISGFLITYLLLIENSNTAHINVRQFYIRRAYRILPAYITFLAGVLLYDRLANVKLEPHHWFALSTFTVNFLEVPTHVAHIWSLSVEEQFYLMWPCIFSILARRTNSHVTLVAVAAIPILVAPLANVLAYLQLGGPIFHKYSFLAQSQAISWGCIAALMCAYYGNRVDYILTQHSRLILFFAVFCIGIEILLSRLFLLGPLVVAFGPAVRVLGAILLIVLSIRHSNKGAFRALNFAPVVYLGTLSYSIYLWQQIFMVDWATAGLATPYWLNSHPIWLLPVLAAAMASHHFVERPFLKLKSVRQSKI